MDVTGWFDLNYWLGYLWSADQALIAQDPQGPSISEAERELLRLRQALRQKDKERAEVFPNWTRHELFKGSQEYMESSNIPQRYIDLRREAARKSESFSRVQRDIFEIRDQIRDVLEDIEIEKRSRERAFTMASMLDDDEWEDY